MRTSRTCAKASPARSTAAARRCATACSSGLFCPLGRGDVPVGDTVVALERAGYTGWYVLEQDTDLGDTAPRPGTGPVDDARASIEYLQTLSIP